MTVIDNGFTGALLLGFDARVAPSLGVRQVSVDYLLWPSAWAMEEKLWRGPVQGLWDSFTRMEAALETVSGIWWLVAIYVELDRAGMYERNDWTQRCKDVRPASLTPMAVIGYDIADRFLTSNILEFRASAEGRAWTNCNFNHLGLVTDPDCARRANAWCDQINPTHAPYFSFRIELIREQNVNR